MHIYTLKLAFSHKKHRNYWDFNSYGAHKKPKCRHEAIFAHIITAKQPILDVYS